MVQSRPRLTLAVLLLLGFAIAFAVGLATAGSEPAAAPTEPAAKAKPIDVTAERSIGSVRSAPVPALTLPEKPASTAPTATSQTPQQTTAPQPQTAPAPQPAPSAPEPSAPKPSSGSKGSGPIISEGGGED